MVSEERSSLRNVKPHDGGQDRLDVKDFVNLARCLQVRKGQNIIDSNVCEELYEFEPNTKQIKPVQAKLVGYACFALDWFGRGMHDNQLCGGRASRGPTELVHERSRIA